MPMAVQVPEAPTVSKNETGLKVTTPQAEHDALVNKIDVLAKQANPDLKGTSAPITTQTPVEAHSSLNVVGAERVGSEQPDLPQEFSLDEDLESAQRDVGNWLAGWLKKVSGGHTEKREVPGKLGMKLQNLKERFRHLRKNDKVETEKLA